MVHAQDFTIKKVTESLQLTDAFLVELWQAEASMKINLFIVRGGLKIRRMKNRVI